MAVSRHLGEAAERLEEARARIELARAGDGGLTRQWLEAVTDYLFALSDIQRFANESVHEKLHELGAHVGISFERPPTPLPPGL